MVPPTNTKFKPFLLPIQGGICYTNTHKHRTSYFKSTLTFLGPGVNFFISYYSIDYEEITKISGICRVPEMDFQKWTSTA